MAARASPASGLPVNASNPRAQVITAAGEGSAVAIAINTALVQADAGAATRRADAALRLTCHRHHGGLT
jgi:hypothetical protein